MVEEGPVELEPPTGSRNMRKATVKISKKKHLILLLILFYYFVWTLFSFYLGKRIVCI